MKIILVIAFTLVVSACASKPQISLKDDFKKISRNVVYINLKTGEIQGE